MVKVEGACKVGNQIDGIRTRYGRRSGSTHLIPCDPQHRPNDHQLDEGGDVDEPSHKGYDAALRQGAHDVVPHGRLGQRSGVLLMWRRIGGVMMSAMMGNMTFSFVGKVAWT